MGEQPNGVRRAAPKAERDVDRSEKGVECHGLPPRHCGARPCARSAPFRLCRSCRRAPARSRGLFDSCPRHFKPPPLGSGKNAKKAPWNPSRGFLRLDGFGFRNNTRGHGNDPLERADHHCRTSLEAGGLFAYLVSQAGPKRPGRRIPNVPGGRSPARSMAHDGRGGGSGRNRTHDAGDAERIAAEVAPRSKAARRRPPPRLKNPRFLRGFP